MTAAAFSAAYADFKLIKTRGVVSISFEVPVEQAQAALDVLGGMPVAANEIWCAVARLDPGADAKQTLAPTTKAVASPASAVHVPNREFDSPDQGQTHPDGRPEWTSKQLAGPHPPRQQETVDGAKTKTAWRDMRLANQAGMLCNELPFQKFLAEKLKYGDASLTSDAARDYVRSHCNVQTRKDIRPHTVSGDRWEKLVAEYRTCMHEPEYADA